jgi:hypothetical protein
MYNEKQHFHFQGLDDILSHYLNMVVTNMDQVTKEKNKYRYNRSPLSIQRKNFIKSSRNAV